MEIAGSQVLRDRLFCASSMILTICGGSMKALISGVTLFLLALPLLSVAQIPRILSYQGILADSLGNPKADGTYTITFRFYTALSGGTVLWTEQKTLPVKRGLFHTNLGDQVVFGSSLTFSQPYWLSIQVASEPELAPRILMTSTGYSLASIRSDTARYALNSTPFALPYAGTASSAGGAFSITNTGAGPGINIQLTNAANGSRGIDILQNGVGPGVFSKSTGGNALWGITSSISAAGVIGDNTFGDAIVGRNRGGNGVGAVVGPVLPGSSKMSVPSIPTRRCR
jgi:hypothetical protein